jgi:hypothetical protein
MMVIFTDFSKGTPDDDDGALSYDGEEEEEEKTKDPQDADGITF